MRKMEKAQNGQTIRTETGPDRSSHKLGGEESLMGRKMRGGVDNLDHSIAGGKSMVHTHKGATHKGKSPM
jgi:hypothetical protein